jgi:hypothetical protein
MPPGPAQCNMQWSACQRSALPGPPCTEAGEVRGLTSVAVTSDSAGTTAVEAVMPPLVQSMQKLVPKWKNGSWTIAWRRLRRRRCRYQQVEKRDQLGGSGIAWALAWRSAAVWRAARSGVRIRAGLEAGVRDDLVPRPDPVGEGAGSMPQDGVGAIVRAVERWDDAAAAQPDEGGTQQLVWQLGRQLGTGIVPAAAGRRDQP